MGYKIEQIPMIKYYPYFGKRNHWVVEFIDCGFKVIFDEKETDAKKEKVKSAKTIHADKCHRCK